MHRMIEIANNILSSIVDEVRCMKIIPTSEAIPSEVDAFLEKNEGLNREELEQKGYVVLIRDQIEGCFVLDEVEEGTVWLKQLYITRTEAQKLPVLVESIITIAKAKQAKHLYVHSHQPVIDVLLEALQFHPQKEISFVDNLKNPHGNWWAYQVS